MILYRFLKVCRILNAILYSISFMIVLYLLAYIVLVIVEDLGAFDTKSEVLITCTLQSEADGHTKFHGQEYVKLSSSELQKMKEQCEAKAAETEAGLRDADGIDSFGIIEFLRADCSVIGTKKDFFNSFSKLCVNESLGTEKYKLEIEKSELFPYYEDEFLFFLLLSFLSLVVTYSTGYVFFGGSKISPLALFRG
jgi:hypothetical protein